MIARLLRVAVAATAVAGAIGVTRHRLDTVRVRRGELPPASAAADLPPVRPAGRLAERLAGWVPPPPPTPAWRMLAHLWAAPLTVPGLTLALVSGGRPRWSRAHACWIATGVGGVPGLALRGLGADANAIGLVVLSRRQRPAAALLEHEVVHVRQAERLGPLLLPLYLWLAARYGYRDHPLERAARLGARRRTTPGPAST
jgi:hypothetical protein